MANSIDESTGAQGKGTKKKSSQKSKQSTKVKVVLQQPSGAQVTAGAASSAMKECMDKLASPSPSDLWVIPRDFAVESCPINYETSINIDSATGTGVVIDCKPDLQEAITIYQQKDPLLLGGVTAHTLNVAHPAGGTSSAYWNLELHWYDATGVEVPVPSWLVDDVGHNSWDDSSGMWIIGKRRVYAFEPSALGNQDVSYAGSGAVPANLELSVATYNLALIQTSIDSIVIPLPPNSIGTNVVGGLIVTEPLVSCFVKLPANIFTSNLQMNFGPGAITLSQIQKSSFNPAPALNNSLFQEVVSTSSKYSYPVQDVLGTFVGSDLLNGGNVAVGIAPYDFQLSKIPTIAYAQIAAFGGRRYTGPMKNGFHGFYIPDDITRVAFFPMDEKIKGRRIVAAIIPQTISGGGPSSSVSFRLRVRSHLEFINPSQTLPHMTSVHGMTAEFEALLAALGGSDTQVGENPDHIKRMAAAISRAAKDPRVVEAGKRALNLLGRGAKVAIPLLLGALA